MPGALLMILISLFIKQFAEYKYVKHAFTGIRLAVCALVFDTIIKLCKGLFKGYRAVILFLVALVLSAVFSASPVVVVFGAGLTGFLFYIKEHKR